jgi:hypothetical protein
MPAKGWKQLLVGAPWFRGPGRFPIAAYSEYVPPPRLGPKPYGSTGVNPLIDGDPHGWAVTEYEEAFELRPGLETLAKRAVGALSHLGQGQTAHGIARAKLDDNLYWPPTLAKAVGKLPHEHYVVLLPLALSRTQDDKGRIRWTLFGGSEQGPARGFWQGFFSAPGRAAPEATALVFFQELLRTVYGEDHDDLHAAGFRFLPMGKTAAGWNEGPVPQWAERYELGPRAALRGVKYVLSFRPFNKLPAAVQKAYLSGELHLLPFPGSLVFWGTAPYKRLQRQLPLAEQIPLLHIFPRHENPHGIRVPQSGWMHEPHPDHPEPHDHHGPVRNTYKRSHRWERLHRHEDELAVSAEEDKLAHVLFSTDGRELGLYGKPMARNAQVWTQDYRLLLDGPRATPADIERAADVLEEGGLFGYRFLFPAMRIGRHEVYWQRPLAAYLSPKTRQAALLPQAPLGYLTAYDADRPDLARPVELWPRVLDREPHREAVDLFQHLHAHGHDQRPHQTSRNVHKLLDSREHFGKPLSPLFARRMVSAPKHQTLKEWLDALPQHATDPHRGRRLVKELYQQLDAQRAAKRGKAKPETLTFDRTARREFEVAFWDTIYFLAHGNFRNKNNADCVRDEPTHKALPHHERDLDRLGDYLIDYHIKLIAKEGLTGKALVGDLPFRWQTDFPFGWMGGWHGNQQGHMEERDLIVVIPGRDRSRAIIMCDHYDTAYMADCYDPKYGGTGARLAANGADDNGSATATLMLAAPIFLEMSKAGKLGCDIWLVHLTGEEFPADCLGARHLSQLLVERNVRVRLPDRSWHALSKAKWHGVYDLDMIAHNNPHDSDVFQIAPGTGPDSLWLAYQAHLAAEAWNAWVPVWNRHPARRGCKRGRRSTDKKTIPEIALHPELHGEVRLPFDPRSTLYNTDGLIFSDAGVPVVLFMENYDINRSGYHDTHDTMENIDLDYGAAFSAITIEAVARAATEAR